MADLPNFTRGTQGRDESRSSNTEVLTPKPRAVIKPDLTLGHYDLSRVSSNYNVIPPSGRGMTPKMFKMRISTIAGSAFNESLVRVVDVYGQSVRFKFNTSVTTETGVKDASDSDNIIVGINGLSSQTAIAQKFKTTFVNSLVQGYQRDITCIDLPFEDEAYADDHYVIIMTTAPFVGDSSIMPYTNYGSFNVQYTSGTGFSSITEVNGSNGDETIQPPFSIGTKILRGSW